MLSTQMNYKEHNKEVNEVWSSFENGEPVRIPLILGLSSRYFMFNNDVNPKGISYKEYTENPDIMFEMQTKFDYFRRMNIPADYEMGIPEEGWTVLVDFQNYYEAAWLGANVVYIENNVPANKPFLSDDKKNSIFEKGIPDAFSGLMAKGRDYYEYFQEKALKYTFEHAKVGKIMPAIMSTDGPFQIACDSRGVTEFCLDLYEDPEYAHRLLDFITEAIIYRLKAWRKYIGVPEVDGQLSFADDSILLLSVDQYKEFVLPYHKRIVSELSNNRKFNCIHLCGDAIRHFTTIRDELNVKRFDTGFPLSAGRTQEMSFTI
ncbi:MAG: hypothetical protein DDT40_01143 [candidate division WS2 bacterium]|nr:hypothetical protein [Candidatus Psychracetigena formicireducens]